MRRDKKTRRFVIGSFTIYYIFFTQMLLLFARWRVKLTTISATAEQKEAFFMTRIANAAEYRYFSFTGYFYGKASFGLAQQG